MTVKENSLKVIGISKNEGDRLFGLYLDEGQLNLVVPDRMRLVDDTRNPEYYIPLSDIKGVMRRRILGYLRLIDTVKRRDERDGFTDPLVSVKNGDVTSIESMEWILSDYLHNGTPRTKISVRSTDGTGRINWKCTIQTVTPFYSKNSLIFPYLISDAPKRIEDLISRAYRYCVNEASKYIGWLWDLPSPLIDDQEDESVEIYISAIIDVLEMTFVDSRRVRLIHMLNILQSDILAKSLSRDQRYAVTDFDGMYETMIFDVLGNVSREDLEDKYYAKMEYVGIDSNTQRDLRPDAVLEYGDIRLIIDAKYYQDSALPSSSDVMKQIEYAEHVENTLHVPENKICNCFILPDKVPSVFKHKTNTRCSWRSMRKRYDTVHVIYMDFMTLFDAWCNSIEIDKSLLRSSLLNVINLNSTVW